ncbi:hypothetical protein [Alteripontixanthobacter maritimus]|uniref:hypothetical protein n=1 Tax=Alteripontixanthobacter maritimus TaxID=2161824 RepID=UPI0011C04EFF|nr:hypothetical protein [Alteripontixanthobacter maritimus]
MNGLNQLTQSGPVPLGYDARGNLTSAGSDGFTYSSENSLNGKAGAATMSYNPVGRLYPDERAFCRRSDHPLRL